MFQRLCHSVYNGFFLITSSREFRLYDAAPTFPNGQSVVLPDSIKENNLACAELTLKEVDTLVLQLEDALAGCHPGAPTPGPGQQSFFRATNG